MSTAIRPDLSEKNPYRISRHRYYELKHFVMQYPDWDRELVAIDSMVRASADSEGKINTISDPVGRAVENRATYIRNKDLCKKVADDTDPILGREILAAVILEEGYETVKTRHEIPCCKDVWYQLYHKFFWLLDKARR